LKISKPIRAGDRWPSPDFQGVFLTPPDTWLGDYFGQQGRFPSGIPTLIDNSENLEEWIRKELTVSLGTQDWEALMLTYPHQSETIRDLRIHLTKIVFQHPANPFGCAIIGQAEQDVLMQLAQVLQPWGLNLCSTPWQQFWSRLATKEYLGWTQIDRVRGKFILHSAPVEVSSLLRDLWSRQPVVLLGSGLELEATAPLYRQRLGLAEMTCLKFAPDRQREVIQLYLPTQMPMPNTPEFKPALLGKIRQLLLTSPSSKGFSVLLVEDQPLRGQLAAILAAEYGSRVQMENPCLVENSILVSGWQFWQRYRQQLLPPCLLVIATLPIPSPEDPQVAGRVAYYKRQQLDWFRLYLLPQALGTLERAIAPLRANPGLVAILDPRVLHRSYGEQILAALSPYIRVNYLDPELFLAPECQWQDS
jgi:ATP-dependent DNA helicase DinG